MNFGPSPAKFHALFFSSGAAALGAQLVWTQMFAAGLGHEVAAMLAAVTAFLGGMAVGAALLGRRISASARPATWYGALEFVMGGWTVIAILLVPLVNDLALHLTGSAPSALRQWFVTFALPFLLLVPVTAPMGATLPAMERLVSITAGSRPCMGAIYAANTFGAVTGVLGSVFLLMPALGFRASLLGVAAIHLLCGAVAFAWRKHLDKSESKFHSPAKLSSPARSHHPEPGISFSRLAVTAVVTGCLGIGFELVGVRVLSQVLENTIFSYAAALSVFLLGIALGGGVYQRFVPQKSFRVTLARLLGATGLACVLSAITIAWIQPLYNQCRGVLGDGISSVLVAEMMTAAVLLGLPAIAMGATFSHLLEGARSRAGEVGRIAALNTLGCALSAVLAGVLMLPAFGLRNSLLVLAAGYFVMLPSLRRGVWTLPLAAFVLAALAPSRLSWMDLPTGAIVREHREGVMASVSVIQTPDGHRSLRVNHRLQMGGTAAALAERRQAHIPLLIHPLPHRALFLGPATGITLGAAESYPDLTSEGVELVPEVRDLMRFFEPENGGSFPRPRLQVHVADARRFVRTTTNRYDVIVADLFHPAQDGAGFLYTRKHFEAVRQRLERGGLFCQWLPLHQLDAATLRMIVRTFLQTFSQAHALLLHFNVDIPVLGLVGAPDGLRLDLGELERRQGSPELQPHLRNVGLDRSLNLLGCLVAGPEQLQKFAGDASVTTDDWPGVLFAAPRFSIRRQAPPPHELLLSLLRECRFNPESSTLRAATRDDAYLKNLADFISARDIYLAGLAKEELGNLVEATDLYLVSARTSLHFLPAYARCVSIIQVLANTDRPQARRLYQRLEAAQPAQPLARKLFGSTLADETPAPK